MFVMLLYLIVDFGPSVVRYGRFSRARSTSGSKVRPFASLCAFEVPSGAILDKGIDQSRGGARNLSSANFMPIAAVFSLGANRVVEISGHPVGVIESPHLCCLPPS